MGRLLTAGCCLVILLASCASDSHTASSSTARGTSAAEIPFTPAPITGYPLIDVQVNGHPSRFAFDTAGGQALIIAPELVIAAQLPVDPLADARVNGKIFPSARLPGISIGTLGEVVGPTSAAVVPLGGFSKMCGQRVDGIVGAAALNIRSAGAFEIDFPRHRLRLMSSSSSSHGEPKSVTARLPTLPDPQTHDRPFVLLHLGDKRVPAIVDSCEYETVQVPEGVFADSGLELSDARSSVTTSAFGAAPLQGRRGRIKQMSLGDVTIRSAEVQILPASAGASNRALIGTAILRHYRVSFDPAAGTLTLTGPRELRSPSPSPRAVETAKRLLTK
jgi:hypothetical protein